MMAKMPPAKRIKRAPKTGDGKTRSALVADDLLALFRARISIVWINTPEESRIEGYVANAAAAASYTPRCWDVAQGFTEVTGAPAQGLRLANDPDAALNVIRQQAEQGTKRGAWIMRDLSAWLQPPIGITTLRRLRNLARMLPLTPRERAQVVIIISTSATVPPDIANHAAVIEWPLPDRDEIAARLDASIAALPDEARATVLKALNGRRDAVIDATVGLSDEEAQATYARSLVRSMRIDPAAVMLEKKRIIAKERVIEWHEPLPGGLDAVGGLANLKTWLAQRNLAFSEAARAYGLPPPKGALLAGPPGTGKSHTAKAVATAWSVPLLRLDLGAVKSRFVGESESNLRRAFKVIEAIGRCVLWIDEIETRDGRLRIGWDYERYLIALPPKSESLRDDIAVRLGDHKCTWCEWSFDADKVEIGNRLVTAQPMWTEEVATIDDIPEPGPETTYTIGFDELDRHGFRIALPAFMPIIGPYGSGKSVFLRQLLVNLWKLHGWKFLLTSFEEKVKPRYLRDLRRHLIGKPMVDRDGVVLWSDEEVAKADAEIRRGAVFLRRKRTNTLDLDRLLGLIEFAVRVHGVKVVAIDPVNEIDHQVGKGKSKTDYMGRFIMALKALADDYDLLMICCAQPPSWSCGHERARLPPIRHRR